MKTSIRLFLGALLLLGMSLALYDWRLAAEFRKGDYIHPYYNYVNLNYRDFDEIELRSGSSLNVMITQGDYKVLIHPRAAFAVVRQEGKRLIIEAHFPDHFRGVDGAQTIFIACPALSTFTSDAKYTIGSEAFTDFSNWDFKWYPTTIRGFTEDSLTILEDHASNVVLEGDRIRRLTAVVGTGGAVSGPVLVIGQANRFDSSTLDILNRGRLWIKGTDIRQLTYHLADSATLTVNGAAAHYLNLH